MNNISTKLKYNLSLLSVEIIGIKLFNVKQFLNNHGSKIPHPTILNI